MTTEMLILGMYLHGAALALIILRRVVNNGYVRPDNFDIAMTIIASALWPLTLVVIAASLAVDGWKKWVSRG